MRNLEHIPELFFSTAPTVWKKYSLNDLASKIQDGTHFSPKTSPDGTFKYITSKNIRSGFMLLDKVEYLHEEEHRNIYKRCDVKFGDVLLTKDGASTGALCQNVLNEEFSLLSSVAFIRSDEKVVSNAFTYHLLSSARGQIQIKKATSGQAITRITLTSLRNFKFYIPDLEDQQKIAHFLSSVDKKISLLKEKHSLLEQYKKGVMQKIISQEIRFKDENGNKFPDWIIKKGDEVFRAVSNKNHNSDLPILAITQDQGAIPRDLINYQVQVTDKSVVSYKVVEQGDFIISLRSFQGGIEYSNYKGICSPAYIILQPSIDIEDGFYRYYLKTNNFIQEMKRRLEGIRDGKILSYKYFSEINLPYPCVPEQQKIAQFLLVIDKKVDLVKQQIELTQTFKKGLLQQMFV